MSSKKVSLGIGPRLVLWSTLMLAFSLICVSTTVYYLMSNSLRKSDHELITKLARSYAHTYKERGVEKLRDEISPEVIISIVDKNNDEVFTLMPQYIDRDFEDEDEIEQIRKATKKIPLKEGWSTILLLSGEEDQDYFHKLEYNLRKFVWKNKWESILPLIDNDMAEVYTMPMDNKLWIKVGRSSEEREEQLAKIRNISLIVLTPFIFIGALMSFLLSRSVLAPVKGLVQTIRKIKGGESQARARVKNTGDEVDQLAEEFNDLLDHNEKLIVNLKSTVDNVAHDLRTPLTRFRNSAENALSKDGDENLREALQDGIENSENILQLLNAIMDVSEAETKTMKIKNEEIELHHFFEKMVELYEYVAEEKGISFELSIPKELHVKGDQVRLMQAFGNLLDNAVKFSPENSKVYISGTKLGDQVQIIVRDEGPGIPEHDLERIWDRLYRGDKSRSTKGLGIGLSVVKAVITAHKGQILVTNSAPHGASFLVTLPSCNVEVRHS